MSRQTQALELAHIEQEMTAEEIATMEQAWNSFVLTQAKGLLCELWKAGRINANVRFTAESVLSTALYAIENPELRGVTRADGDRLSTAQWLKEQEAKNRDF